MFIEFPRELWYKIKSYEYQLIHYPIMNTIINDMAIHSYMPYYLSVHKDKGGDKLFDFMLMRKREWVCYFKETQMEQLCYKYDSIAKQSYD